MRRALIPGRGRTALVLASAATAALVGAAPALAAYPGHNGKIAFTSTEHGARHIFETTSHGIRDLTGTGSSATETQPEFSPNGREIAFARSAVGLPNTEIFVMRANGSHRRNLTRTQTGNGDPTWSPNGRKIAFVSDRKGGAPDVYVMRANGTHVHRITHNPAIESELAWAPKGNRIAFVREPAGGGDRDIYSMRPDGSHRRNLTRDPNAYELNPDYSPNGRKIVYSGPFHPHGSVGSDLWVMRASGGTARPLQHESNGYSDGDYPAWSPDGTTIAFAANNGTGYYHLWSVPASGGQNTELVTNNETGNPLDQEVDWEPRPARRHR